jgi:uncharacterized protein YndB with AHSA1/START domain
MAFQKEPNTIRWKMHFKSPREEVFQALATDVGRARFWGESAPEVDGRITFNFVDHPPVSGRVLKNEPPRLFAVEYFDAVVEFSLHDDGSGGTDLALVSTGVPESNRVEIIAGWVSVLMAMKAAVDFGVDLRNHDESRAWNSGYADN